MSPSIRLRPVITTIFVASGFAGLIYQSIWSHYLGLLLGHAAYAQTLVLAIFMGGMAVGAWLASRRSTSWRRLFIAYALIELLIGLLGLVFHPLFVGYTDVMQGTVLPALGVGATARTAQWLGAALLITPQTILLGMTFPIMSAAWLRTQTNSDSEVLGGLYFSNSIGAAVGALVGTFVLLPASGLPGTVMAAGLINILVALVAWALLGRAELRGESPPPARLAASDDLAATQRLAKWMLTAAFITGASSFVYEIGWVRLLNQALGTTIHSFEIMLSAFIAGLALGGLWVARRRGRIADPLRLAAIAQVAMGALALLSLVAFAHSFELVAWLMRALSRSPGGYALFSLGSAAIAIVVMMPAAFFAGMTLPLFTVALLRAGVGERAVGRVYASNTIGAIIGVFLAVHVLIPLIGIRLAVTLAALADIVLGIAIIRVLVDPLPLRTYYVAIFASLAVAASSLRFGETEPLKLASAVFRTGTVSVPVGTTVDYQRDGKTSTITVTGHGGRSRTISTNGKPDAALSMALEFTPQSDEITMIMAGALPILQHPNPRRVAIIGWGSGLTTHTVAGSSLPETIENIEIERAMHEGAKLFGERVARAYRDPRSVLHVDDARTFFASRHERFDVVVSEPSNPWVSGVANLFTREWYAMVSDHLDDDGVLVQWLQTYEISDELVATMVAALIDVYPHIDVYSTNTADLLFVAGRSPRAALRWDRIAGTPLEAELARVGLGSVAEFEHLRIGNRDVLAALVAMYASRPHSDYYPTVSLEAPRQRFVGARASALYDLTYLGMPVLEMIGVTPVRGEAPTLADGPAYPATRNHHLAKAVRNSLAKSEPDGVLAERSDVAASIVAALRGISSRPMGARETVFWSQWAAAAAGATLGFLGAPELQQLWIEPAWIDPAAHSAVVRDALELYGAAARRDGAAMAAAAERVLAQPANVYHPTARSQYALLGVLGYIGSGRPDAAASAATRWDGDITLDRGNDRIRSFLKAWLRRGSAPDRIGAG